MRKTIATSISFPDHRDPGLATGLIPRPHGSGLVTGLIPRPHGSGSGDWSHPQTTSGSGDWSYPQTDCASVTITLRHSMGSIASYPGVREWWKAWVPSSIGSSIDTFACHLLLLSIPAINSAQPCLPSLSGQYLQ